MGGFGGKTQRKMEAPKQVIQYLQELRESFTMETEKLTIALIKVHVVRQAITLEELVHKMRDSRDMLAIAAKIDFMDQTKTYLETL